MRSKKTSSSPPNNLIDYQSTPYTDKDGENPRPWYIEENGKANGVVVIVVFLLASVHRDRPATAGGVYQSTVGTDRGRAFVRR